MPTPTKPFEIVPFSLSPPDPEQLLQQITSGSMALVKGRGAAGLILVKRFTADLVLFGGAVGVSIDRGVDQVIPIGQVYLSPPRSYLEKQWAIRRRGYWINWQQQILEAYPTQRRAEILLHHLLEHLPPKLVDQLSDPILGKIVVVKPEQIRQARELS